MSSEDRLTTAEYVQVERAIIRTPFETKTAATAQKTEQYPDIVVGVVSRQNLPKIRYSMYVS